MSYYSGSLQIKYDIYVRCMLDLRLPVKSFDDWLNT